MYNALYKQLLFPLMEKYYGTNIQKNFLFLEKSQWWTKEQLHDYQEKKLKEIIYHAYENVPYYHRIFESLGLIPDDIKNIHDLNKLPLLKKEDVRNYNASIRSGSGWKETINWASGGSTGEPLQFVRSKADFSWAWAAAFRGWNWAGYDIGDKYATVWGSPVTLSQQKRYLKKVKNYISRNLFLSAYEMNDETMRHYIDLLRKFNPQIIRGYSQAIYLLAKYLENSGISSSNPKAILTTAEMLFDDQREVIERAFRCRVYDGYGGGEAPAAAYECPEHQGYHISAENFIIEFVKNGEPVSPGERGKIVITNLNSHAMPFIRYDMGDVGRSSDEGCPCGRCLPLIKSIEGRINDFTITNNGNIVHNYFFSALFRNVPGINQFQVIQEDYSHLIVKIVKNPEFKESQIDIPLREMKNKFGENSKIEIEYVDEIPLLRRSGKRRFVISKVPLKL